ncbi:hypothetical protein ASG73_09365 [Janibacter sp. Soil728]|uniref:hypothetical protein n=1 Tax=Janibacter sp. Soil728 TaxID=1736393 RepID=UPI0006FC4EAF|nr:hypothetical protein [Janibacter sp. Soil728]KRE37826.1 hypothetical protein ASG73_09365 [Janibacter sp. Soil728]
MLRVILVALLGLPVLVVTAPAAHACSCARTTPASLLRAADLVAEVRVQTTRSDGGRVVHRADVWRAWKGPTGPSLEVRTAKNGAACGMHLEPGRRYVLIATGSEEQGWQVGSCGGTFPYDEGGSLVTWEDVVAEYGVGTVTEAASDEVSTHDLLPDAAAEAAPWVILSAVLVALAMTGLGLGLWSVRVRRRGR